MIFTAIWEKITIPKADASGDNNKNNTTKSIDKNKSDNKDKSNKKNPKTGITSILAEVNALVALMFGYKNLKKKDWKIASPFHSMGWLLCKLFVILFNFVIY